MWVVLNLAKAHRFTTKGINLHKGAPSAYIPPDLEAEYKAVINEAIDSEVLIKISDKQGSMIIKNQGEVSSVETNVDECFVLFPQGATFKVPGDDKNVVTELGSVIDTPLEE